jgi:medium-chain acyl-[acyl-carrier-protein] hydrolase
MNGTPAEVLENPELMDILLPLLRADFAVSENYTFKPESPLKIPISAFGGVEDTHITREEFHMWNEETSGPFALHMIQGDHFFLNTAYSTIIETVERELLNGSFVVGGRMSP